MECYCMSGYKGLVDKSWLLLHRDDRKNHWEKRVVGMSFQIGCRNIGQMNVRKERLFEW